MRARLGAGRSLAVLAVLGLLGVSYALEETLCGDTICGTYGTEPSFDDDNRPPDGKTLGRAGWTAMHTTAMYLPDTLTDAEQKSFVDLVHSALLYPGNVSRTAFRGSRGSRADEIAARTRRHAHVRGASLPRSTAGCGAATLWCPWRGGMEEAAGAASFGTLNTIWNFWHNPQTRTRTHSTQTHKHMYAHACM
eukprot:Tamp_17656.p1 GENE.Tamp_17656~~Tamp_17656.p1  ORF type:complete len:193 (+),score=24.54 Tamp_17656:1-579(+)